MSNGGTIETEEIRISIYEFSQPTNATPGSFAKLEVMRQRAELGLPLFVAGDNQRVTLQHNGTYWNCPDQEVINTAWLALTATLAARRAGR